ncbi:hypothetical protein ACRB8A_20100 (plasmid) [Arthrobacter sp. G.S.26]|uniref:hypothetical protein n=1 Tax=Arthrobacter sp. G.S.26 TaxID=3433706 RepID=UPI003D773B97
MSREAPYSGPSGTNDFDGLTADEMAASLHGYRLLGECFEDSTDEEMMGRGFLLDDPLLLVRQRVEDQARVQRELAAAVRLARYKDMNWWDIGEALGVPAAEARQTFRDD